MYKIYHFSSAIMLQIQIRNCRIRLQLQLKTGLAFVVAMDHWIVFSLLLRMRQIFNLIGDLYRYTINWDAYPFVLEIPTCKKVHWFQRLSGTVAIVILMIIVSASNVAPETSICVTHGHVLARFSAHCSTSKLPVKLLNECNLHWLNAGKKLLISAIMHHLQLLTVVIVTTFL